MHKRIKSEDDDIALMVTVDDSDSDSNEECNVPDMNNDEVLALYLMLFLAANVSERDLIVSDDECNVPEINDNELPLALKEEGDDDDEDDDVALMVTSDNCTNRPEDWFIDSAATSHMTFNRDILCPLITSKDIE